MSPVARLWLLWLLSQAAARLACAQVQYDVKCTDDSMVVDIVKTDSVGVVYLERLKHYTDPKCHPQVNEDKVTFSLSLKKIFDCGTTRVKNERTGQQMFYQRIIVEMKKPETKEVILAKCIVGGNESHSLDKRSVLPAGFQEPDDLNITNYFEGKAPAPILDVGVRQGGQLVTGELNVNPGTPLQMEIFLDKNSAAIYGLLVSYMMVTDTKSQEEIIIFNGCSVDPYLFENFNTVDGDFLTAKFRAFKFPESTYVEFKGTVNVCLDKCRGVECSNGQSGFGRRRREIKAMAPDPNKLFEVTLTTFIKVDYEEGSNTNKGGILKQSIKQENDTMVSAKESTSDIEDSSKQLLKLETEEMRNELKYVLIDDGNSASIGVPSIVLSFCIMLLGILFM